jgi:hypothetical protein
LPADSSSENIQEEGGLVPLNVVFGISKGVFGCFDLAAVGGCHTFNACFSVVLYHAVPH